MEKRELTRDIEARLGSQLADWKLGSGENLTFGKVFSLLLEQQGLTRSQLADRMSESPFNRDEAGEIRAKRGSLVDKLKRWTDDRAIPDDRGELFQICILMGLRTEDARRLFERGLMASWVHKANRDELIYLFCLDYGMDIQTAYGLIRDADLPEMPASPDAEDDLPPQTITRQVGDAYEALRQLLRGVAPDKRVACFKDFLQRSEGLFHTTRQKRMRIFREYFESYRKTHATEWDTDEADLDGTPIIREKMASIISFADDLRLMRVPDAADLQNLQSAEERRQMSSRKRIAKLVNDNKRGDANPIRKVIPRYLSGEKDIPRDIFIKTYILCEAWPDYYDLCSRLQEAGYPDIYVRAADGFDALVYHIYVANEAIGADYEAAYEEQVTELMTELRHLLDGGQTPRL